MNVSGICGETLAHLELVYRDEDQRAYLRQDGLSKIAYAQLLESRLFAARDKARLDAIRNLARYKFSNFGYHAARWVTLNALIGDKRPNPFRELVQLARTLTSKAEHLGSGPHPIDTQFGE